MIFQVLESFFEECGSSLEVTEPTQNLSIKFSLKDSIKELQGSPKYSWIAMLRLSRIHKWSGDFISSLITYHTGAPLLQMYVI